MKFLLSILLALTLVGQASAQIRLSVTSQVFLGAHKQGGTGLGMGYDAAFYAPANDPWQGQLNDYKPYQSPEGKEAVDQVLGKFFNLGGKDLMIKIYIAQIPGYNPVNYWIKIHDEQGQVLLDRGFEEDYGRWDRGPIPVVVRNLGGIIAGLDFRDVLGALNLGVVIAIRDKLITVNKCLPEGMVVMIYQPSGVLAGEGQVFNSGTTSSEILVQHTYLKINENFVVRSKGIERPIKPWIPPPARIGYTPTW